MYVKLYVTDFNLLAGTRDIVTISRSKFFPRKYKIYCTREKTTWYETEFVEAISCVVEVLNYTDNFSLQVYTEKVDNLHTYENQSIEHLEHLIKTWL